jgi:hypothetical protein
MMDEHHAAATKLVALVLSFSITLAVSSSVASAEPYPLVDWSLAGSVVVARVLDWTSPLRVKV